jgi:rhomboid protease GluP
MAVGLTPKFSATISLNELTSQQFLVIAIETVHSIHWEVNYASNKGIIAYTNNPAFKWNAEIKITIEDEKVQITSTSVGSEIMDSGRNKKAVQQFITAFEDLMGTFTSEELVQKYEVLFPQLVPEENDILTLPPPTLKEQLTGFLSVFNPSQDYFITPILVDINILVFIIMAITGVNIFQPDNESLLRWGANFRPLTLNGEWWRLITCCFLHIGILHLVFNMYALISIGSMLEPLLGKARFIAAYLLAGITASLTSLWWHDLTISVGASGAIFGMYGVFLALLTTSIIEKNLRQNLMASILTFVGYNLVFGLKSGVDNAAHLGGLAGGILIGYAFVPGLKNERLKYPLIGIATLFIVVLSFVAYKNISNDIGIYDAKMKAFFANETTALEIYKLPAETVKDTLLYRLKDKGINYWNKNISLLNEIENLKISEELKERNHLLKKYCQLRIKSYQLIYKDVEENTQQYRTEIEKTDMEIEKVITELNGK